MIDYKANKKNIAREKAYTFAIQIVLLCQNLQKSHEYILSKQLLRSGTSICANIQESIFAQSRADFISKLSISLKEAHETDYWLQLLCDTRFISFEAAQRLRKLLEEIRSILIASIKTAKQSK